MKKNCVLQCGSSAGVPAISGFSSPQGGICCILSAFQKPTQSKEICSYSENLTRNKKHVEYRQMSLLALIATHRETKSTVSLQQKKQVIHSISPGPEPSHVATRSLGWHLPHPHPSLWEGFPDHPTKLVVLIP